MSEHESPFAADHRAFGLAIIERIEANTGLEIRKLFEQDLSAHEIRERMRELIVVYVERTLAEEKPSSEWPLAGQPIDVRQTLFGASGVNVVPDVAVTEQRYQEIRRYQGQQIQTYLKKVTDGLSLLKDGMTPAQAAATIAAGGLASFGVAMIWGTFVALQSGAAFMSALAAGVVAMGSMTVVVGVALVIVAELLIFFLVLNKKVFLGMVFNNTGLNLVVRDWRAGTSGAARGDLFMNTGSMTSFMETHENPNLDSPLVQVVERLFLGPGNPDNLVSAGIFCAEKNFGFYGTEGVMLLSPRSRGDIRFAFLFACPYTLDNGVNVAIGGPDSARRYFDSLYSQRGIERHAAQRGFSLLARVGFPRGGEACGFVAIDSETA
jgi:hypothetical protein